MTNKRRPREQTRPVKGETDALLAEDELADANDNDYVVIDETAPVEVSLEELEDEMADRRRLRDLEVQGPVDTQHSDGSAYYSQEAEMQGLVYTPPDDPPVIPSDDLQGIEIAAGFGQALEEEDDPRPEIVPDRVANNAEDLEEKIRYILRKSSETAHLGEIDVRAESGTVYLGGTVDTLEDIDIVVNLVQEIDGVTFVEEDLEVAVL
jgi:hypothetical protein